MAEPAMGADGGEESVWLGRYRQERTLGSIQLFAFSFAPSSVAVGTFGTGHEVAPKGRAVGQAVVALESPC